MDKNTKMEKYFDKVEDCLLNAAIAINNGQSINTDGVQVLLDGVRIFHHIKKIREDNLD